MYMYINPHKRLFRQFTEGRIKTYNVHTVEPLIVDPLNKGHNRNNLSIKDTSLGPKCSLSHSTNTFLTSKERTTSLQWTKWLVPTCPLFGGFTVYEKSPFK